MATDIIRELLHDHEQVKRMFTQLEKADGSEKGNVFWDLTNELVRHEVAEEEIVYPEVRRSVPNGNRLADARIKEQAAAEELLDTMEKAGPDDAQFGKRLAKLRKQVLEHADKEERLVFEPLRKHLDSDGKRRLGNLYEMAKASAPTHPHPTAPDTPPGNLMVGPVAALIDRARDAMHKAAS